VAALEWRHRPTPKIRTATLQSSSQPINSATQGCSNYKPTRPLHSSGVAVTGSTAGDGVFWSTELQQTTDERSPEFHLCIADEPTLHTAAEGCAAGSGRKPC
jgi:hypothetical protein